LATGSALVFDGTNLGVGTSSPTDTNGYGRTLDIRGSSTTSGSAVYFGNSDATARSFIAGYGSSASNYLQLGTVTANSYVSFVTVNSEKMRLDSSGNLGLGVTPSAWGSTYRMQQIGSTASTGGRTAASQAYLSANWYHDGTNNRYITSAAASQYQQDSGVHYWFTAPSGTAGNAITFTQAMTLDASGNLLVGTTNNSQIAGAGVKILPDGTDGALAIVGATSTNTNVTYRLYSTGAAAYRFYVGYGGTVYATSTTITAISDVRLKENIRDLDDGLNAVMALKPRKFDWKAGKGKDKKDDRGWIAQEFEQVFPDMVDTWADPAPEGEEPYKAVNADLIPTLVKAMQEQQALIQSLTDRIAQLEAK
jgi:hypothetical protein